VPLDGKSDLVEVRSYRIKPGHREEVVKLESYDVILCETSRGCVFDWKED
jgi:hypothetical protein